MLTVCVQNKLKLYNFLVIPYLSLGVLCEGREGLSIFEWESREGAKRRGTRARTGRVARCTREGKEE